MAQQAVTDRQVERIMGRHAQDLCLSRDGELVEALRGQVRATDTLRPLADELYETHSWLHDDCLRLTRSREEGEDLSQSLWARVLEGILTPGRGVRYLHGFIGGVLKNLVKELLRATAKRTALVTLEIETADGPMERTGPQFYRTGDEALRALRVDKVLAKLDSVDQILVRGYLNGRKLYELKLDLVQAGDPRVAEHTSESTIKTYQNTAFRRFKARYGEYDDVYDAKEV